jgi:hypothetical protein
MRNILLVPLLLFIVLPAYGQEFALPDVHEKNGIQYLSGGAAKNERDTLKTTEKDYNLKVSSISTGGDYTGAFSLKILNARGDVLLDITTEGPVFYANLPVGQYQINGKYQGQEKTLFATVSINRLKMVNFSWKE